MADLANMFSSLERCVVPLSFDECGRVTSCNTMGFVDMAYEWLRSKGLGEAVTHPLAVCEAYKSYMKNVMKELVGNRAFADETFIAYYLALDDVHMLEGEMCGYLNNNTETQIVYGRHQ